MRIATTPLDREHLTAAEITLGDGPPWVFLPFEDRTAEIEQLGERHVLARARPHGVAIFDCVARRRTSLSMDASLKNHLWTFAEDRGSVFIVEKVGDERHGYGHLRELSLDGTVNRSLPIAEGFHATDVQTRDDGAIVCINKWGEAAIFDPETATSRTGAIEGFKFDFKHNRCELGFFSPDGRWALRAHLGSVIREQVVKPSLLTSLLGRKDAPRHPDLKADGQVYYGVGLDLVRLDPPIRIEKTLVIRYLRADTMFPGLRWAQQETLHELQRMALGMDRESQNAFEVLAARHGFDRWNGRDQLFMARFPEEGTYDAAREEMDNLVDGRLFRPIRNITWDTDSGGFTVVFERLDGREERHIRLDGEIGPLTASAWTPPSSSRPWGTEALTKALRKDLRARSVQRIAMADLSAASLHTAVRELADRMEAGLQAIVFRDTLQLQFKIERRTVSERAFFAAVDSLAPEDFAPILPDLRRLLSSFVDQAARHHCTAHATIIGGGEPEDWKLALSDAALVLARRDPAGHDILTGWFRLVDQEHDSFAAERVFPAIATATRWATPGAARFGLWFVLHQWQTVSYDLDALGIIDAAKRHWTPELFARMALDVAQELVAETGPASVGMSFESCLGGIEEMLDPADAWQGQAQMEAARLFQVEPTRSVHIE